MEAPETQYAKAPDGAHVAYQTVGSGEDDLIYTGGLFSFFELAWRLTPLARFFRQLGSIARVLVFDPRGTGASDRIVEDRLPTLETRMADAVAVMDAAGSERAAVLGFDATGPVAVLMAATFPERTTSLILYGTEPCALWHEDYPWGWTPERWEQELVQMEAGWGTEAYLSDFLDWLAPSARHDVAYKREMSSLFRLAASPAAAVAASKMERDTDVRHILPAIHVPTIVLHRTGDLVYAIEGARYTADRIAGARLVELQGDDHFPWFGDSDALINQIAAFLATARHDKAEMDRVLATVMFTDIVGSTKRAADLGDRGWAELLDRHHEIVRAMLARHRGREIDTAGDGFLAMFDGPARAIRCAQAIVEAVRRLGIEIRAGCHTGEIEVDGDDVRGIAVHIGSRVAAVAGPSQVLVSSTVRDLVAGSGLAFEDAGEHELKGVPDRWHLYRVEG